MGTITYSDEFKRDAVQQITVRDTRFVRIRGAWG